MQERFTTITRKGQITIPADIRKALGLKVGDRVALVADHREARLTRTGSVVQRTAGALKSSRGPLSPQQEQEEFEQGVAEEVIRTRQDQMAALPFIDTNIFLRHLLGDHPQHSPKATALFERIERGDLRAQTSEMVVFETVFTLERSYGVPKAGIRDSLLALLALSGLVIRGKRRYGRIFELYVDRNLPFGDAYIVAQMEQLQADQIYSFDRELDRKAPGITRLEPSG